MTVAAVAAVPASPLLLPSASPAQPPEVAPGIAALRDARDDALRSLPAVDTVILVAGGAEALLHDASVATLASYGLTGVEADLDVDPELLGAVAARGQAPRLRSDRLDGDLAVLALQVAAARPELAVLPATVPVTADADSLGAVATGLARAAADLDRRVAVLGAADLSATRDRTSPGYLVHGAIDWDTAAAAAVRDTDLDALAALGPDEARRVQARGWAPLVVLLHVARTEGLDLTHVTELAPRGVGQLVAW